MATQPTNHKRGEAAMTEHQVQRCKELHEELLTVEEERLHGDAGFSVEEAVGKMREAIEAAACDGEK